MFAFVFAFARGKWTLSPYSDQANAKISFDDCRLFSDLFRLFFDLFHFRFLFRSVWIGLKAGDYGS